MHATKPDGAASAPFAFPGLGSAFTVFFMLAVDLAVQGTGLATHVLSTRLYDVAVGCAIALAGTLVTRAATRPAVAG